LPEEINIAALGGRGGGKTFLMALLALRYAEQY
jgi:DNA replication protein DnaC